MDVVNVESVLDGTHTHRVGRSVSQATTNTATRHPNGIAAHMMITAIGSGAVRRPSHFAGPHNQRVVEQSAPFEIHDQGRNGLVRYASVFFVSQLQRTMLIPRRIVAVRVRASNLDESHSRFDKSASSKALQRIQVVIRILTIDTIERERFSCLA